MDDAVVSPLHKTSNGSRGKKKEGCACVGMYEEDSFSCCF